ncbi:hypothetical protein ABZ474_55770, partial [Streptomyces mirabilis]
LAAGADLVTRAIVRAVRAISAVVSLPDAPARGDRGGGYLASDLARGVNGTTHALDFGALARPAFPA